MYLSCAVGLRLETPWIAQCSSRADQQSSHSQSLAALAKPKATHHILVLGGAGPARRLCGHAAKDFAHTSERSCYSKLGVPVNPHFTKKLLPPSSKWWPLALYKRSHLSFMLPMALLMKLAGKLFATRCRRARNWARVSFLLFLKRRSWRHIVDVILIPIALTPPNLTSTPKT